MNVHDFCRSRLLLFLLSILTIANSTDRSIPVIYVSFGDFPLYLRLNIELAARNNHVIVLSDVENIEHFHWASNGISGISNNASSSSQSALTTNPPTIHFESLLPFATSANRFAPLYRHMCKDHSNKRINHELRCFQRWFILQDYMQHRNLSHTYFSDGDSSVFTNISHVVQTTRANCSAVINIEAQFHDLHWVGAGEASVWTLPAIVDLCAFMQGMYKNKIETLRLKYNKGSSVVDMSLLWLWWVSHHLTYNPAGWEVGRPFAYELTDTPSEADLIAHRKKFDSAFDYAKSLDIIKPGHRSPVLVLCNGMDAVGGYTFDHYHGWKSGAFLYIHFELTSGPFPTNWHLASFLLPSLTRIVPFRITLSWGTFLGRNFSLGLGSTIDGGGGDGVPSTIAASQYCGGRPTRLDPEGVALLSHTRLRLVNLHYQGNQKQHLAYDVCRVLLYTGTKTIVNEYLQGKCQEEIAKRPKLACQIHEERGNGVTICF